MDAPAKISEAIAAVRELLTEQKAAFNAPATDAGIQETEARLGIILPDELRELYRAFDGTRTEAGDALWRFWPLAEVATEDFGPWRFGASSEERALHLCFCDALIWCPRYAVCVEPGRAPDAEVWMIMGDRPDQRSAYYSCSSVLRFLELLPTKFDQAVIMETAAAAAAVSGAAAE